MKAAAATAFGEPPVIHEGRPLASAGDSVGEMPSGKGKARIVSVLGAGR
ncbi:hypothetical protein [Streptomyces sp. NPDC086182]|jgi:hypothetical protein